MAQRTDVFELGRLGLTSGEARRLDLNVAIDPLEFGGERYTAASATTGLILDVVRTIGGYSLRMRFSVGLEGPCMRCLEPAAPVIEVDARELEQEGAGEDLESPYVEGSDLDLRAWARDALALELPTQIVCREDCLGLCAVCGADLNHAGPGHAHEQPPDHRWAKLAELRLGDD
ncbi:MAG: DUF177 domain-containing protein [Thermoleophilaceae bacterium]